MWALRLERSAKGNFMTYCIAPFENWHVRCITLVFGGSIPEPRKLDFCENQIADCSCTKDGKFFKKYFKTF